MPAVQLTWQDTHVLTMHQLIGSFLDG